MFGCSREIADASLGSAVDIPGGELLVVRGSVGDGIFLELSTPLLIVLVGSGAGTVAVVACRSPAASLPGVRRVPVVVATPAAEEMAGPFVNAWRVPSSPALATPAPVAQRIEHRPPEPVAQVRVLPGAPL